LSLWDFVNNRYTHNFSPMLATFSASALFDTLAAGDEAIISIRKNGTSLAAQYFNPGAASTPVLNVTTGPVLISYGDFIDARVHQNTGAALDVLGDVAHTWIRGNMLWVPAG
jgi:hypothetical protein